MAYFTSGITVIEPDLPTLLQFESFSGFNPNIQGPTAMQSADLHHRTTKE